MPLLESWLADLEQRLGRAWCWTSAGGRALTRGRALSDDGSICRRCASTTRGSVKQKKKGPSMSSLTLHHRWSQEEVAEGTRQMSLHLLSTCTCPVLMACSRRADRCLAQFYLFLILFLSYTITEAAYLSSLTLLRVRENDQTRAVTYNVPGSVIKGTSATFGHVQGTAYHVACTLPQSRGQERRRERTSTRQAQDRTDGSVR